MSGQNISDALREALAYMKFDNVPKMKELNTKYRKMALEKHPDKNNGSEASTEDYKNLLKFYKLIGEYIVEIESFNSLSTVQATLKTDQITITVIEAILPSFVTDLEFIMLTVDQEYSWQLPEIDEGSYALLDVEVSVPVRLSSYITFDEDLRQFTYDGNGISDSIGG